MNKDLHLVPVMVQQMIESYLASKDGSQEKFQLETRLIATAKAINSVVQLSEKDKFFK